MKGITKKQSQVLDFISHYIDKYGYSPSYREIQDYFQLHSPASVHKHIHALKRKGVINQEKNCSRSINLEKEKSVDNELLLPYIGYISLAHSIEPFSEAQSISVPSFLVPNPKKTYVIQVQGNFLKDELIVDGDLLLVEIRSEVEEGELVLVQIKNATLCVKRYYSDGTYAHLKAQHSVAKNILLKLDDVKIQGVIVGMIRLY